MRWVLQGSKTARKPRIKYLTNGVTDVITRGTEEERGGGWKGKKWMAEG